MAGRVGKNTMVKLRKVRICFICAVCDKILWEEIKIPSGWDSNRPVERILFICSEHSSQYKLIWKDNNYKIKKITGKNNE